MKKIYAPRHTRNIAIPKKLDKELEKQAKKEFLSVSALIRKMIAEYLKGK